MLTIVELRVQIKLEHNPMGEDEIHNIINEFNYQFEETTGMATIISEEIISIDDIMEGN